METGNRQTLPAWMKRIPLPYRRPKRRLKARPRTLADSVLDGGGGRGKTYHCSLRAASQVGKTMLALGVALRAAVRWKRGPVSKRNGSRDPRHLSRRVEGAIARSPFIASQFPSARSGPGARASWRDRRLDGGRMARVWRRRGARAQLASRTAAVCLADEVSRWPRSVRSGEGHPLVLLRARLADWGSDGTPHRYAILEPRARKRRHRPMLFRDGDRSAGSSIRAPPVAA